MAPQRATHTMNTFIIIFLFLWTYADISCTEANQAHYQTDPWTVHDPGFPVRVLVSPYDDAQWEESLSYRNTSTDDTLHISSTVVNITIVLPPDVSPDHTEVVITMYESKAAKTVVDGQTAFKYEIAGDSRIAYATTYRLIQRKAALDKLVLRVYVEASAAGTPDPKKRAFYVRMLDFSPSEPQYLVCDDHNSDTKDDTEEGRVFLVPPTNIPSDLCKEYTLDGKIPVRKWYFDDQTNTDNSNYVGTHEEIEKLIEKARDRNLGYYGVTDSYLFAALEKYSIKDKHVLIIGSTTPWYESICIVMEAASCTTIDYNRLYYDHPKLQTYTVAEFQSLNTRREYYDAIFAISSHEHDGLGRYGDPLNPDGDLIAMTDLLQYVNPSDEPADQTLVFLAVPIGPDVVVWNAQRIYGLIRLPMLLQNWKILDSYGFKQSDFTAPFEIYHQPVFVLQAKSGKKQRSAEHMEL